MTIGNYAFKKIPLRLMAGLLDRIGYLFRRPVSTASLRPKRILVVRLDQLGDIVQTLPFFDGLKASFPQAQVDFLTTPSGAELFGRARPGIRIVDKRYLRPGHYDCVFELRGDIRLLWMLRRRARPAALVGYGATGGGFLLDVEAPWERDLHAVDKNLRLLESIGGRAAGAVPIMEGKRASLSSRRLAIAVHPDAGTSAKKWPLERFIPVIDRLTTELGARVVLVGLDEAIGNEITARAKGPLENRMGKTTLPELVDLLSDCDGLLSNDSGPAHLMAALGKPVWVVWSGTANARIWAPRGTNVTLFQHAVACAPCSRRVCNVDGHPCLTGVHVDRVTDSLVSHLRAASLGAGS